MKKVINFIMTAIIYGILLLGSDVVAKTVCNWLNFEYTTAIAFIIFCLPIYWFGRKHEEKNRIANSLQSSVNSVNLKVTEDGDIIETEIVSKKTIKDLEEEIQNIRDL